MAHDGFDNSPSFGSALADNVLSNFSGIFSTRPGAKYSSGARCVLRVNGTLIGFAFGVSWRINTEQTEIQTIDDYVPWEYAPQRITVEGSLNMLHIPGQSATALLIQPDIQSFLFHRYISIEVRDSKNDDLLFFTNHAVITTKVEDIRVDQLSTVTLNWKAIGWKDEREPDINKDSINLPFDNPKNAERSVTSRLKDMLPSFPNPFKPDPKFGRLPPGEGPQ